MSLDITPYLTADEAYDYFESRSDSSAWECVGTDNQLKALKTATRFINRLRFRGSKIIESQVNEFPRQDRHGEMIGNIGTHYNDDGSPDLVPDDIKIATCEIAISLLDGVEIEEEIDQLFVSNNTYANVSTGNSTGVVPAHIRAGIPSSTAWTYLRPYLCDPRKLTLRRAN